MKTLTLLRHAKSGGDEPGLRDYDRPLNAKGRRAAEAIGRHLRGQGFAFDRVVASPALRVAETLDAVADGYGASLAPDWDRRLYLATAETLLDVAREQTDGRVLLVGHNPGLEDLVLMLAPECGDGLRDAVERKYPTASVAELRVDSDWGALDVGGAVLTRFVRPRDLDPSLGPDADGPA